VCKGEKELKEIMMLLYEKRFAKILLKPTLFRLSYEICGGKSFDQLLPIAAAFEVLNISSYQANASFDNKVGVLTKEEKDSQFMAAMISREIADKLVDRCEGVISESILTKIKSCLSRSNSFIYKAQHYDLNLLSIKKIDRFPDYDYYLAAYNNRCYFGSGVFSGQCALAGAIAANASHKERENLLKFAELYGTALHQINDLADYFPGAERKSKIYQDDFCDFKNGRLTLPLYLLLTSKNPITVSKISQLSNKQEFSFERYTEVQNILVEEGIVDACKDLTKTKFIEAKKFLQDFELCESKRLLLVLLSVLDSNKFYHRTKQIAV
jgi:geranylgeranyl pyrophosphate synthase